MSCHLYPTLENQKAFVHNLRYTTVKPVLSGHSKIDKTKVSMADGSLIWLKVLQNAPLGAFCNTFDLSALSDNLF